MNLNRKICDRARLAKDPRFDGLFFTGVLSTGIYCRPICPAPVPKPGNVIYFNSAAAAAEAGLRPCMRCRPEASPGSPAWNGTSTTVSRAILLIRQGILNDGSLEGLSQKLGVGSRHLRRLFKKHVGVSPLTLATTQKILFAKKMINETDLPFSQIAFASGFGSIRRFNAAFNNVYGKPPSAFRQTIKSAQHKNGNGFPFKCEMTLCYRPPFDWKRMLGFFRGRAIPGVEVVESDTYHRTVRINKTTGTISVSHADKGNFLKLTAHLSDSCDLMPLVDRVRRIFDLDANMAAIHGVFTADPLMAEISRSRPGLRLPGAWDPFEIAIRAVVGQQISVKGARTVIGRIVAKAGPNFDVPHRPELTHLFPTAGQLAKCELGRIGMPQKRVATIQALSQAVSDDDQTLAVHSGLADFIARLTRIPGIGDWTAQYIAMRALGEPDAFPAADLGIIKALQKGDRRPNRKEILTRAENWRPWRAYAAIYLWSI